MARAPWAFSLPVPAALIAAGAACAVSVCVAMVACSKGEDTQAAAAPPVDGGGEAAVDTGPPPVRGEAACREAHLIEWPVSLPPSCAGKRTCVDGAGHFWVEGKPFFPRGVYNGGSDANKLFTNCPEGAACRGWNPVDLPAYVRLLADAGINLIQERSRYNVALLDAVHGEPRMKYAHLLWSDPYTPQGHDDMEEDIKAAAADPSVVMWFGPDEIDLNDDYPTAAGIRRILRGPTAEVDVALRTYPPPSGAYLPDAQAPADTVGLPFGAALAFHRGVSVASTFYDVLMPVAYPIAAADSALNDGQWGTWRGTTYGGKLPFVPVLQMIGIPEMSPRLAQPTPAQVRGLLASSLAHGATGAFYYTLISDKPKLAGRDGWFAPDDRDAWAAFTEMHRLEDDLTPVMFSGAEESTTAARGVALEARTWRKANGRRVVLVVNPRAASVAVDLVETLALVEGESARAYADCEPVDATLPLDLEGYGFRVFEAGAL